MAILLQNEKKPTTDALIWSFTVQHNTKYTETIFIGNLKKKTNYKCTLIFSFTVKIIHWTLKQFYRKLENKQIT